jgi:hypothetical protein
MKLQYLHDGSPDCPIIRLFDFSLEEICKIYRFFDNLANESDEQIELSDQPWIERVNNCSLSLHLSEEGKGIIQMNNTLSFACVLTQKGWINVKELTQPFCEHEPRDNTFQWLDETSNISLLLSYSGRW